MASMACPGVLPVAAALAQSLQALSHVSEAIIKRLISRARAVIIIKRKAMAASSINVKPAFSCYLAVKNN